MGNINGLKAYFEEIRSINFNAISNMYEAIGGPFLNPCRILYIQNLTDADLMFSINGDDDHFVVPAEGFIILDTTTNRSHSDGLFFDTNTQVYVKEIGNPNLGDVYLSVIYSVNK